MKNKVLQNQVLYTDQADIEIYMLSFDMHSNPFRGTLSFPKSIYVKFYSNQTVLIIGCLFCGKQH